MGNTIERKILFVGLSGAGSTQLLYSLKLLRSPDVSFKPSNGTLLSFLFLLLSDDRTKALILTLQVLTTKR